MRTPVAYNAIASGSAILTANADGLKAGLDRAAKDVQGWGKKVQGGMGGAGGGGGAGGTNGVLGSLVGGAGGAAKALPWLAAGTAAVTGFGLAAEKVVGTLDDLAKQDAIAKAMGLTAEQFTGMAGVAKSVGEDTREFLESLVTMGKLGTDAAAGTKEASAAFKGLGLDANAFVKLRADEQFFQIFDALQKVQDPLQRTRFLMNAFGEDGGKYLLPLLSKTPDQIREMARGFAVTGEEMKKAAVASQSLKRLEASVGKLWRGVAVMAAPLVEGAANFATKAIAFVQPFFDWLGRGWNQAVAIGTAVWDAIGDAISEAIDWVREIGSELFAWAGSLPTIQEVVVMTFRAAGTAAAYVWDTIKAGAGASAIAFGIVTEAIGQLVGRFKETVSGLLQIGGAAASALGQDGLAAQIMSASKQVQQIGAKVEGAGQKLQAWGKSAIEGFGQSADKFNQWLNKALKPKAAGEELGAAVGDGMRKSLEPLKLSAAVMQGSKEAYSMIVKNNLRALNIGANDPQKKQLDEAKKGNAKLNKIAADAKRTADAVGALGVI